MNLARIAIGVSLAAFGFIVMSFWSPRVTASTAVRHVRVFDGERVLPDTTVVIRNGLIESIGAGVPDDAEVIEGEGRTLLPGLIDSHVHAWADARRDALRFGVTTELDMFTDHALLADARAERASLARTDRADLWSAGTLATSPGGHGTEYGLEVPPVSNAAQAPEWVAARKAEGSDYIKIVREDLRVYSGHTPTLDSATSAAVIDAAHAQGLKAVVHASAKVFAAESLRDGADGLVHVFQDEVADDQIIEAARDRFVVPTLTVIAGFAGEPLTEDPRLSPFLTAAQKQTRAAHLAVGPKSNPIIIANARESVRRLHAAGVVLLAGTDAPNPHTAHGASLHEELEQLTGAGLSPLEALVAATSAPARVFSLGDRGRIAAGLRADLVLVEGDPTRDITATRAIVTIFKNGHVIDRSIDAPTPAAPIKSGLVSDFEVDLSANRGMQWLPTSDRMAGGKSTTSIKQLDGAMRIAGEIVPGGAWPWAGVMLSPTPTAMKAVDAAAMTELVFRARGDGREYNVMLFSGAQVQSAPVMVRITPAAEWSEHRVAFASFAGADLGQLRGIGLTAGLPAGAFQLDIDSVEIR